jgi:hypothetical protein
MKFSIRDILWLTILAAVSVAWWLDHRASVRTQDELQRQAMQSRYLAEIERAQRALAESQAALERTTRELQAQDLTLELQKAKQYFEAQRQ